MSDNRVFSADEFMSEAIDESMDSEFQPCPEGTWLAQLADQQPDMHREAKFNDGRTGRAVRLTWNILDEDAKASVGREALSVRQEFLLDLDANGKIATGPGKNIRLGQLREALGLNKGPFRWDMLLGAGPARVRVRHRADKNDPEAKYAEVSRVLPR